MLAMTPYFEEIIASLVLVTARKEAEERPRRTALAEDDDRSEALKMTERICQRKDNFRSTDLVVALAHLCLNCIDSILTRKVLHAVQAVVRIVIAEDSWAVTKCRMVSNV